MKTFAVFLFAVVAVAVANQMKPKIMQHLAECRKEFNIEDDKVDKVLKLQQIPQSDTGKCLLACVLKKLEFIKGNKYNWERSMAMNRFKFTDEEDIKKADGVVKICGDQVKDNTDECLLAADIAKCAYEESTKAGLPIPKWA